MVENDFFYFLHIMEFKINCLSIVIKTINYNDQYLRQIMTTSENCSEFEYQSCGKKWCSWNCENKVLEIRILVKCPVFCSYAKYCQMIIIIKACCSGQARRYLSSPISRCSTREKMTGFSVDMCQFSLIKMSSAISIFSSASSTWAGLKRDSRI